MPLGLGLEKVKMETLNGKTGVKWFIQIMDQKQLLGTACTWMLFQDNGMPMTVQSKPYFKFKARIQNTNEFISSLKVKR